MASATTTTFVQNLYKNILQREGETGGINYWLAQADAGMSASDMTKDFIYSTEGQHVTAIVRLYDVFFNRAPDSAGLSYWVSALSSGTSLRQIANAFSTSSEFQSQFGSSSTASYVEAAYGNILARPSDPEGKAYWIDKIDSGAITRGDAGLAFAQSSEALLGSSTATRFTDSYLILRTAGITEPSNAAVGALSTKPLPEALADQIPSYDPVAVADSTAPVMSSAAIAANGSSIVITYSENLTGSAEAGDYAVSLGSGTTSVTTATIGTGSNANQVTLALGSPIVAGNTASVAYTAAAGTANSIRDAASNAALTQTLAPGSVSNNSSASIFTLTTSSPTITEIMVGGAITKAMAFTLTLGSVPSEAVVVNYETLASGSAASGTDFVAATGTVTFVAGQTVANVSILINDDAAPEPDETVSVLFSGSSLAGNVTGTGTILKNDTAGLTVVLTAGTDLPVLGLNDDTINSTQAVPVQLDATDIVAGGDGTDTLTITPTIDTAFTLDDAIFNHVSGIDKIVIADTGTGGQTITSAGLFQAAFGAAGVDLQTTATTAATGSGMAVNLSAVTGPLTLTTTTTTGAQTITTGNGNATVFATASTGAVGITTGTGADTVTLTTSADTNGVGCVINTGAGNDSITIIAAGAAATSIPNLITGGLGADTITLGNDAEWNTLVIGNADSCITLAGADRIIGFVAATDTLKMGTAAAAGGGSTTNNYVEAGVAVSDFAAALGAANIQLAALALATTGALEAYAFQWDASNGYLFNDTNGDGTADQFVMLVGIIGTAISEADIVA